MQSKNFVRPFICLFTFSVLLAACAGAPAQPTSAPATVVPATPVPSLTPTEMPSPTPEIMSSDEFMARQDPVGQLIWSADGKTLVVGANSGLYTLDTQADAAARPLEDARGFLSPLALDRQGLRLLAENRAWDVASGKLLYQLATKTAYHGAFSPDGKTLVVSEGNSITLWDAATGKFQKSIGVGLGTARELFFESDGSGPYVVYGDKIKQVNLATGKFTETGSAPTDGCCVLFSPDGQYVMVYLNDHGGGHKEVRDVASNKVIINAQHCDSDVTLSAFSTDSRYFVTGPCRFDAQLWDVQSGQLLHSFPSHSPDNYFPEWRSAAFSPDGSRLALSNDIGEVLVWDLKDYRLLKTLDIPQPTP